MPLEYLGTALNRASDYRLKLASSLSEDQKRQECSGSGWHSGNTGERPLKCRHPLKGPGAQRSPGYKNPDFMLWLKWLGKVCCCCCYISAALTAGILQIGPFVIINCLWSSVLWAVAVYINRTAWTNQPAPRRNTRLPVFQDCSCKTTCSADLFGRKGGERGHLSTQGYEEIAEPRPALSRTQGEPCLLCITSACLLLPTLWAFPLFHGIHLLSDAHSFHVFSGPKPTKTKPHTVHSQEQCTSHPFEAAF